MGEDRPEVWPPGQYPAGGQWPTAPSPVTPDPAPPTTVPPPRAEPAWGQARTVPGQDDVQSQWPAQWPGEQQQWPGEQQQWAGPQQAPPQWSPQPPPGPTGPGQPGRPPGTWSRAMVLAVAFAVVVLLAGGGVGWWLLQRSTERPPANPVASSSHPSPGPSSAPAGVAGGATAPGTAASTPASRTTPPSQPTADPQAQALAQLAQLRQQSLPRVTLDGRWVAQVASKSVGITDPLETAENGTHTFYATDILAESLAARNLVSDPSQVYVLWGTDFGKRSQAPDGKPYWVTVVDAGFASSANVQQWCQSSFPTLNQQQLADTCAPRQLSPPHN